MLRPVALFVELDAKRSAKGTQWEKEPGEPSLTDIQVVTSSILVSSSIIAPAKSQLMSLEEQHDQDIDLIRED